MRGLAVLLLATGCYSPELATGVACGANDACPAGQTCVGGRCERTGAGIDAAEIPIDACMGVASCEGADQLVVCGVPATCANGCEPTGTPHCRQLVPSNGVPAAAVVGATADVTGNWDIYTDDGEIRRGNNELLRPAGEGVINGISFAVIDGMAVFGANSWTIPAGETWDIEGDHPLVLIAATTISIEGNLDAGGESSQGGPGGLDGNSSTSNSTCRGRAGRFHGAGFGEGGGGGGGATAGGDGGASNVSGATGIGGATCSSLSTTVPLRGGAGGGHGAATSSNFGGGGGGAVQLVALVSITVDGAVGVPGAGGDASPLGTSPSGDAGGGGGAGGAILVEAPLVTITGALTANGGGGAAPVGNGDGDRGSLTSATPASGGSYAGPGGTATGGRGGAGTSGPTDGGTYTEQDATPTTIYSKGAGGGGAVGRIEIRATTRTTTGAVLSPMPTLSTPTYE